MHLSLLCLLLQLLAPTGASDSGIVGGREAKPHSRPYMVSLQNNGHHVCGGLLIRKDFVLTSGHCLLISSLSPRSRPLEVVLGAHNISEREATQQRIEVEKYHKHPFHSKPRQRDYDIMLLKLKTNARLNKYVKVIGLPKKDGNIPEKTKCSVAGWGLKRPGGVTESVLQETNLTILNNSKCKYIWKKYFFIKQMICTHSGSTGICQGDSGGPLICGTKPQGIAAFTAPECNDARYPNIYMKIPFFIPWIKEIIGELLGPGTTMKALLPLCLLLLISPSGASESGIIGGKKAKPHSRPYMASFQIQDIHVCGGLLIREDFVLTAAHCIQAGHNNEDSAASVSAAVDQPCNPKTMRVVLGAHNLKQKEKSQQKIPVKKCIKHKINEMSKFDFDIMLLKLQRNATLNKYVQVKALPKKGDTLPENTRCLMSGWGRKKPDGPAQDVLQDVVLTIQSSKDCKRIWKKHFSSSRMICTHFDGKKGICQGDSGGALICNNKPHGIAAFTGDPCDQPYPNVYTKISYLLPWIKENMEA
ncbi:transmembrane protease serine 9-like [Megalops cyprinoides]|uniref:transmembrane protease serine 9-like n=1 Tax=Megalops cyprinoides TaxID=118141 RepID=UPI00186493AB|nr:transmembrane protease serine 9-like [Megalops cyprinoides]